MNEDKSEFIHPDIIERLHRDLADSYDEEFELELDDRIEDQLGRELLPAQGESQEERRLYFRELFRLQGELVKLQDWVVATGHKLVIVFEGRDAAGKGGHHQAHHATAQSARLPRRRAAGTKRQGTHPVVLPALCRASASGR